MIPKKQMASSTKHIPSTTLGGGGFLSMTDFDRKLMHDNKITEKEIIEKEYKR